ncbi:MAG: hypothetical protein LBB10_00445 [Bifidobacteriaceae bacterium]|jgi:hypothetical protein|nr:hypothetical protein [Bifidobacteriaceae bacterium]
MELLKNTPEEDELVEKAERGDYSDFEIKKDDFEMMRIKLSMMAEDLDEVEKRYKLRKAS